MTKRFRTLIAGFAGIVLVATACTPTGGPSANESPAASDKPQQGGKIIEGDTSDIATMQPVLVNDTRSRRIVQLIYDDLIRLSLGLEDAADIIADLSQALDAAFAGAGEEEAA